MKKTLSIVLLLTVIVLTLLAAACSAAPGKPSAPAENAPTLAQPAEPTQPPPPAAALDGKALLQERCTGCHNLGKVESRKMGPDEWKATVERMLKKGATLTAEEQQVLVDYLAATYHK